MRTLCLACLAGLLSLALLGSTPSEAKAQRGRALPAAPMMMPATSTFRPTLGVQPSSTVVQASVFPFSPRIGTFSAVPLSGTFTVPTYASSFPTYGRAYNAFLSAQVTRNYYETYYHFNPYAVNTNPYFSSNGYYNSYSNTYALYYNPSYYPYPQMYSGGYGSAYAAALTNPYQDFITPVATQTVAAPPSASGLTKMVEVGVYDNRFEPRSITISPGTTVRWTNYSDLKHSVTSDTGLWDSRGLNAGSTTSYTFSQPGKYTYRSALNGEIRGTVIVQ